MSRRYKDLTSHAGQKDNFRILQNNIIHFKTFTTRVKSDKFYMLCVLFG